VCRWLTFFDHPPPSLPPQINITFFVHILRLGEKELNLKEWNLALGMELALAHP
jgi:hypothetical protein